MMTLISWVNRIYGSPGLYPVYAIQLVVKPVTGCIV